MAFYFLYIFVVGVLLYPHESQSFEVSDCEKKYVHLCSMNFAKVLENGDEEAEYRDVLDVHCKAYQVTISSLQAVSSCHCRVIFHWSVTTKLTDSFTSCLASVLLFAFD